MVEADEQMDDTFVQEGSEQLQASWCVSGGERQLATVRAYYPQRAGAAAFKAYQAAMERVL